MTSSLTKLTGDGAREKLSTVSASVDEDGNSSLPFLTPLRIARREPKVISAEQNCGSALSW
jgi:hypothetical protein